MRTDSILFKFGEYFASSGVDDTNWIDKIDGYYSLMKSLHSSLLNNSYADIDRLVNNEANLKDVLSCIELDSAYLKENIEFGLSFYDCTAIFYVNKFLRIMKSKHRDLVSGTCSYCGGTFIYGKHLNCPHCGAPIKDIGSEFNQVY